MTSALKATAQKVEDLKDAWTAWAQLPPGTPDDKKNKLKKMITELQDDLGIQNEGTQFNDTSN